MIFQISYEFLFNLIRLIMCNNKEDLRMQASWDGKGVLSRQKLMDKLQGKVINNVGNLSLVMLLDIVTI